MAFEAGRTTIGDLVGRDAKSQLRIPYYQRGYSWETEHVETFVDDILSFVRRTKRDSQAEYFLGPIVLMTGPPHDRFDFVIDGQQRLSTSQIFVSCVRDISHEIGMANPEAREFASDIQEAVFSSRGPEGGPRVPLRLGDLDQKYFEEAIQKFPRSEGRVARNKSEGRIQKARNTIFDRLSKEVAGKDDALAFLRVLRDVVVNRMILVSIYVDNDRQAIDVFERINCRGVELAETDLILNRVMSTCSSQAERKQVRAAWNKIETKLGDKLSSQAFLRCMWIARLGSIGSKKLYDISSDFLDESGAGGEEFLEECLDFCEEYVELLAGRSLKLHHEARDSVWAVCSPLGAGDALPLLLASFHVLGKSKEFSRVARAIEGLVVRHSVFADLEARELRRVLHEACAAVWNHKSKDEIAQAVIVKLREIDPTLEQMRAGVDKERSFKRNPAVYVLRELQNARVDGAYKATATLEHIFPQKPSQAYTPNRRKRLKPYLNHIGNLTLLTANDNAQASNRPFGEKKKKIYKTAELEIASEVASFEKWGLASIKRRAGNLTVEAATRWRVE